MSIRTEMKVPKAEIEKMLKALEEEKQAKIKAQKEEEERIRLQKEKEEQKKVQMAICENIKTNVRKNPSMSLAQEEILEDDSVLLVINI